MRSLLLCTIVLSFGCAHQQLSASDLDRVQRPAFISRIEDDAGPKSFVFRKDGAYKDRLGKLDAKEADRRLALHLAEGNEDKQSHDRFLTINRFQVADTLRATTFGALARTPPWNNAARPGDVASTLQSFLVQEVPANQPDYDLLKPMGVDAVVELVVEEYGMRSEGGRAGVYVKGYGRMFRLDGGGNIWFRSFSADQVESHQPNIDPFAVNKDPSIFRAEMVSLLKVVAGVFARDLTPAGASPQPRNAPPEAQPLPKQDDPL